MQISEVIMVRGGIMKHQIIILEEKENEGFKAQSKYWYQLTTW